jgi:hypothetical protein
MFQLTNNHHANAVVIGRVAPTVKKLIRFWLQIFVSCVVPQPSVKVGARELKTDHQHNTNKKKKIKLSVNNETNNTRARALGVKVMTLMNYKYISYKNKNNK